MISMTMGAKTAAAHERLAATDRLLPQLRMMVVALWGSPVRNRLLGLAAILFVVIVATAYGQLRLNDWNQPFYDALSKRNLPQFAHQLGVFGVIAGVLLTLNVGQRWLGETLKLRLRQGLGHDLVSNWLTPGRAFKLSGAGEVGVNPDQRMHEDARHLTELSADLGIELVQSSILLVSFVEVLWALSSNFAMRFHGHVLSIPGYMVWAAIVYSGSASLASYWVGRTLIARNAERYAREADLRFSLVRINEHIDAIALARGEADEERRLESDLNGVLRATARLVSGVTRLTWVTAGYGWFTMVAPILAAAPLYFAGTITFGGLMKASGAFMQVQSSLRWFVDNFSTLADWRATLLRVADFRRALLSSDAVVPSGEQITYQDGPPGFLTLDALRLVSPSGSAHLQETHAQLKSGARVAVVAQSGAGKTLLFRALAGLWPWGSGTVTRAAQEDIWYMPRAAYLPPGTLREVLAYPSAAERFDSEQYTQALTQVGLDHLAAALDTTQRWDRDFSDDDQHGLAFARTALHRPVWLLIDEVLESLDEEQLQRVTALFAGPLKTTGILYIGRDFDSKLFPEVLHLIKDAAAPVTPDDAPVAALAAKAAS